MQSTAGRFSATNHDNVITVLRSVPIILAIALGLTILSPSAARAEPRCRAVSRAISTDLPSGLSPGSWLAPDDIGPSGKRGNPLAAFRLAFQERVTLAGQTLEIRGFVESGESGGRSTVVLMTPAAGGFCVLNSWMSPASERISRLVLASTWRSTDLRRAVLLVEASGAATRDWPASARAVALGTDAQQVWTAFESTSTGLAFAPQPGTVALLGAGTPLYLDDSSRFRARPGSARAGGARAASQTCPTSGNRPLGKLDTDPLGEESGLKVDQWIPTDEASQLYSLWNDDLLGQVVFRKLLRSGGREIEAVGITGSDAVLVLLARASQGFCVLNSRYWAFGGGGVRAKSSWWHPKNQKLAVLLFDLTFDFHHTVAADDPREEQGGIALTLDGLLVRRASEQEQGLARANLTPR